MFKINTYALFSPIGIFAIYILASALAIMGFHFFFPGEAVLPYFSFSWRLIQGFLGFLGLFPALALSALVIPFGFKTQNLVKDKPFSPQFLESLKTSIIAAISAAVLYGILFSIVTPIARNYEANIRFQDRLYRLARELAQENADLGEWDDVAHYLNVCDSIWPNGPEHSRLITEAEIWREGARVAVLPPRSPLAESAFLSWSVEPPSAAEALEMAETALAQGRFFDAHWLATLGSRLARPGSAEIAEANRLAGMAWQGVNSMEPNAEETRSHAIYRLKREGHEALVGEEWIRAYYIFLELLELSPEDPDVGRYLAMSENGVKEVAFFIEEMELTLGSILTGAVFSFPSDSGRLVMRISSLSTFSDSAYGMETEIMAFDRDGLPLWSVYAPYAKIFPLVRDSGPAPGSNVAVLLRALDRTDRTRQWEPVAQGQALFIAGHAEIVLEASWDDFLLLSKVRRGLSGISPAELRRAAEKLGSFGYQPQIFETELLRRFVEPLLLLPLGILAIIIGWRYRAIKRPRYIVIPMLGILPMVFNGVVHFCRGWLNNLEIWAVISLGFAFAAVFFAIGFVVFFVLSLIMLAAQHG